MADASIAETAAQVAAVVLPAIVASWKASKWHERRRSGDEPVTTVIHRHESPPTGHIPGETGRFFAADNEVLRQRVEELTEHLRRSNDLVGRQREEMAALRRAHMEESCGKK